MKRIVLLALLSALPARAEPESLTLAQGVVVRVGARSSVYVMDPRGGTAALDTNTGKTRWYAADAAAPLVVLEGRLVALAPRKSGGYRLVTLDAETGKGLRELGALPGGIVLGDVMGGHGEVFAVGDLVGWSTTIHHVGGATPPAGVHYPSQVQTGAVRVNLAAGTLESTGEPMPQPRVQAQRWTTAGVEYAPFEVNGTAVHIETETPGGRTVLRHGDAEVLLIDKFSIYDHPILSANRRHLMVGHQLENVAQNPVRWDVTLWSTARGEKLGTKAGADMLASFVVVGNRVIEYWPDEVRALALPSLGKVYSRPVRDLRYHGTYPPSAARPR